jgi:hypothetical protein
MIPLRANLQAKIVDKKPGQIDFGRRTLGKADEKVNAIAKIALVLDALAREGAPPQGGLSIARTCPEIRAMRS